MKETLSEFKSLRLSTTPDRVPTTSQSARTAEVEPTQAISPSAPATSQAMGRGNSSRSLENLPPEIRRHILFTLNLEELEALVHASAVFHQQYLLDRRLLLSESIENELQSVTVDAMFVYRSTIEFSKTRSWKNVALLIESYRNHRKDEPQSARRIKDAPIDEILSLVTFHNSIIKPMARHLTGWLLANLAKITESPGLHRQSQLSRSEELRVFRGLYRFQLACFFFGRPRNPEFSDLNVFGSESERLSIIFLFLFEPWEVEEITCVHDYVKEHFIQIFDQIRWDVHPDNPRFADQPRAPTPEGAFDLEDDCE